MGIIKLYEILHLSIDLTNKIEPDNVSKINFHNNNKNPTLWKEKNPAKLIEN